MVSSGISFIARQNWKKLNKVSPRTGLCWVVLEQVRSFGNLGTLIRSSEAIGGAGFILLGGAVDPFAPATIRASMGGLFRQHFIRANLQTLQHWIRRHKCCVVGASPDGGVDFHHFKYSRPTLLFLGEERQGLTSTQRDLCQHLVRIPMSGAADLLNVAVAGSLLLYEVHRSRHVSVTDECNIRLK